MTANSSSEAAAGCPIQNEYCAKVSKNNREDPIGSAPGHRNYLFVEIPLPWEYRLENSRHFPAGLAEVLAEAAQQGASFRFLGCASEACPSPAGHRRVMYYSRTVPFAARFEKREYVVPEERLTGLVAALLRGEETERPLPAETAPAGESRDLFVCTHGGHDVCCGKFGYPIYKEIEERYASASAGKLRVWRTSHFGGHRHAPTMIDFPEGRYWAQLTPEVLDTLLLRRGPVSKLAAHYRGWGGVGPYEQAVERELFIREGWDWIGYEKRAELLDKDEASARVRVEFRSPGKPDAEVYEALVRSTGTVVTGGCGHGPSEAKQYELVDLAKRNVHS